MSKSATEVMQEIVISAVLDAIAGLKASSKGVPNALLRDLSAIHPNTALDDLPGALRAAVAESTRNAFSRLQKEGFVVAPAITARATPSRSPGRGGAAPRGSSRGPARD